MTDAEMQRAEIEAVQYVLRAFIDSHPAPRNLVNAWRRVAFDATERARPRAGHVGLPTYNDTLFRVLDRWSTLIHANEAAGPADPMREP